MSATRLPVSDALALVRRARAGRRPVLGITGYESSGATRPDHVNSIDFVGASCRTNPWAEAEAFLEERDGTTMHFEVMLGDPPGAGGDG